jgi:hypothetical protein
MKNKLTEEEKRQRKADERKKKVAWAMKYDFAKLMEDHEGLYVLLKPFKTDGNPANFIRLLIPFLEMEDMGDFVRKDYILNRVLVGDTEAKPNTYKKYLWYLNKANIVETAPRGAGFWRQGKNFKEYMSFIHDEIMKFQEKKETLGDFLIQYKTNTLDFMMKS